MVIMPRALQIRGYLLRIRGPLLRIVDRMQVQPHRALVTSGTWPMAFSSGSPGGGTARSGPAGWGWAAGWSQGCPAPARHAASCPAAQVPWAVPASPLWSGPAALATLPGLARLLLGSRACPQPWGLELAGPRDHTLRPTGMQHALLLPCTVALGNSTQCDAPSSQPPLHIVPYPQDLAPTLHLTPNPCPRAASCLQDLAPFPPPLVASPCETACGCGCGYR